MLRRIWIVFAKEAVDNFRDRRSLSVALLYPFIGPVLVGALIAFVGEAITSLPKTEFMLPVKGSENAPGLVAFFRDQGVHVIDAPADARGSVRGGRYDAVLIIPDDYEANFAKQNTIDIELLVDRSRLSSMLAMNRAVVVLRRFNRETTSQRLRDLGVEPATINPLRARSVNVAVGKNLTGFFLNTMPPFIIFTIFLGGMYLAIDTIAGERERGSLEPLLANPIARWELMAGKVAAAFLFTAIALAIQLIAFKVMFDVITAGAFNLMEAPDTMVFIGVFLLCGPLMILAVALQVIIATASRSFKETQTYLGLLPLVPSLPGLILVFVAIEAHTWMMTVPIFNQTLLIAQLLRGETVNPIDIAVASAITVLIALGLLSLAAKLYGRDNLVTGG